MKYGGFLVESIPIDVNGPLLLVAAPVAGFRIRGIFWAGIGNNSSLYLRDAVGLTARWQAGTVSTGRPFAQSPPGGVAFGEALGVELFQGAVIFRGQFSWVVEPVP